MCLKGNICPFASYGPTGEVLLYHVYLQDLDLNRELNRSIRKEITVRHPLITITSP